MRTGRMYDKLTLAHGEAPLASKLQSRQSAPQSEMNSDEADHALKKRNVWPQEQPRVRRPACDVRAAGRVGVESLTKPV